MDKSRKLRRYLKKDYSQVVDFPVEIVGRDGVVRRYSFEASVRLYQRRISSAANRYDDGDLVGAEVYHCQRRIEQLRRSYFQRYGWSALHKENGLVAVAGEFAGEVAAFLRRFYGEREEAKSLEVDWVQDVPHGHLFFAANDPSQERYLLYLFYLDPEPAESEECAGRAAFFELLRTIQSSPQNGPGEGVERLIAFHHTADCALVLSGTEIPPHAGDQDPSVARRDPVREGMRSVNAGDLERALQHFEAALAASPYQRKAYVACAVVADALGRFETAEMSARMGLHYFPDDPTLLYHLGLAMFRADRMDAARSQLEAILEQQEAAFPTRYLLSMISLARGQHRRAHDEMASALDCARDAADAQAVSALQRLRLQYRARQVGWIVAALIALLSLALIPQPTGWMLMGVALALGVAGAVSYRLGRFRALAGPGHPAVQPSPPEGLQAGAEGARRLV